jgi:hypothetical protein
MKRISLSFIGLLFSLVLFAQKQIKDANAEVRNVKGFHAVKVSTGIELILTQGNTEAVAVSARTVEHRENIITKVENGVLKIYYDHAALKLRNRGDNRLKAYVSIINIDDVNISSGASVNVEGVLQSPELGIDISSGAMFNGKVKAGTLVVDQSSGSVSKMSGTVQTLKIDGSSGSVFNGYDLVAENGEADISSGGVIEITVNKELKAFASSGGSITYKGNGVIRNVKTGSGGSVSKKG